MTFVDSCTLLSRRIFSAIFVRKKFLCISASRFHMDFGHEAKATMEVVNVPPIRAIHRLAMQTFSDSDRKDLAANLKKLKTMMDQLRSEDLAYDKSLSTPEVWKKAGKAPCSYIEVFQNSAVNMSVFVLRPGFKMPLHDHPHMHGLLKVISGAVNIRSFTEHPLKEAVKDADIVTRAKLEAARLAQGIHKKRRFFAKVTQDRVCTDKSGTCMLTPVDSNYHEITALDGPAAFFDILSPPYDTLIKDVGPRRCRYYRVVNEISTNVVELQETEVPDCFYCDQAPYLGPSLA